jgi:Bacterial archaeo-eukaryotic release factor family 3
MKLNKTTYPDPKQFNRNNRPASFQPDWNDLREDVYYRDLSQRGKQPVSKPITIRELQTLLTPRPGPCISLYLPTHRRLPQAKQDPVRFKNLMRTVEGLLRKEYTNRDTKALLQPLEDFARDDFWYAQMGGLALFRSSDLLTHYRMPMRCPELAVVADSFHVRPLLHFLQSNRYFYVLTLSQNRVNLYEGSPYSLCQVDLPELPKSLDETFGKEQQAGVLNAYDARPGQSGAIYYGYGAPPEERVKEKLAAFFRVVDLALWDYLLRDERVPLVLAGVGYHHPIYRSVSRYGYLVEQTVEGNFDYVTPEQLHAKVWPVVHDVFTVREKQLLDEYAARAIQEQTVEDLSAIAQATVSRRVSHLLIARGTHVWGLMDRASGRIVHRDAQHDTRDGDVLDDLAEATLAQGGEVVTLERAKMPGHSPAAAMLRW